MYQADSRRRRRRLTSNRGASLVETLVALGLLAVGAGTMGRFLVQQIRFGTQNYMYTQAYSLAEDQLETLRAQRYNEITAGSKFKTVGGTSYVIATGIQANVPSSGLKTITINVSWASPQGPKNVAVQTIYTEVQR